MTGDHEDREDAVRFDALIERSSLGTPGARRLRERITHAEAGYIRQLSDLLEALRAAGADETLAMLAVRAVGPDGTYAMALLAELLTEGDWAEARHWLERAADAGDTSAMALLGKLLADQDPAQARHWLERAGGSIAPSDGNEVSLDAPPNAQNPSLAGVGRTKHKEAGKSLTGRVSWSDQAAADLDSIDPAVRDQLRQNAEKILHVIPPSIRPR